jgi:miniconductance mechanosensitive channel
MYELNQYLYELLLRVSKTEEIAQMVSTTTVGLIIFIVAFIALLLVKRILVNIAHKFAHKTKTEWDDILLKNKFFLWIAHFMPASIIYFSSGFAEPFYPGVVSMAAKIGEVYYMVAIVFTLNAFLSSINEIYNKSFKFANERPIAGFIQLLKIFIYFIAFLTFISIVFDRDLMKLLTGLGAMAAVLMLIFKDSILGFVAGVQISMNNMVKIGDWIEMPTRGADGSVIELSLVTVKVENWDRTISHIPTYALISESFINWKGMEQSGGRRIKRSINIDMNSVKFCNREMLEKFEKFRLIQDYVIKKQEEIDAFNEKLQVPPDQHFNGRKQTNLGVFRKYLEEYLHKHPMVNNDMTFLIRHLQPSDKGIPVEVYVFCKDKRWPVYESIQADIFDHIIAILPEFELKIFQTPSGTDLTSLASLISAHQTK